MYGLHEQLTERCTDYLGVNNRGQGLLYTGITDCISKVAKTEGLKGFYKGWTAVYFRIGPHSFFNLLFWDYYTKLYKNVSCDEVIS